MRHIDRGEKITADLLNQIKRGVSQRIIGGKGIRVQEVGGRTIISRKREQIVPQSSKSGHVWGLNSNLRVRWAYDATDIETDAGGASAMFCCPDLCVTANEVCASFSAVGAPGDSCKTVAQFTTAGVKEWGFYVYGQAGTWARGVHDLSKAVGTNLVYGMFNFTSPTFQTIQAVNDSGSVAWTTSLELYDVSYSYSPGYGCTYDGSDFWLCLNRTAGGLHDEYLYRVSATGTKELTVSSRDFSPDRMLVIGSDLYCAGGSNSVYGVSKFSTSNVLDWEFSTGSASVPDANWSRKGFQGGATDVCVDGDSNVYAVGFRRNDWTGAGGTYASVWALNDSGTLLWTWDSGAHLEGCCLHGGYLYVCGRRSNSWTGGSEYRNIWKLDLDGNLIASVDLGVNVATTPRGTVWVIRSNGTHLFCGTDYLE